MANPRIQQIMEAIEDAILAEADSSGTLSFMDGEPIKVLVSDEQLLETPKQSYKRYLVVLYPDSDNSLNEVPRLGGLVRREFTIGISLWRKVPRKRKWLIFSDSNDTVSAQGSYEFANLIMDILRNNNLSGLIEHISRQQFSTAELVETGEGNVSHISFDFFCETLETVGSVV